MLTLYDDTGHLAAVRSGLCSTAALAGRLIEAAHRRLQSA
jgi:hypothetical protein